MPGAAGWEGPITAYSLTWLRNPSPWQPREGVGKRKGTRPPCRVLGRNPSGSVEGEGGLSSEDEKTQVGLDSSKHRSQQPWALPEHSWWWCHVNAPSPCPHEIQHARLCFTKTSMPPDAAFPSNPHNCLTGPGSLSPLYSRENQNSVFHGQMAELKLGTSFVGL